MLKRLLRVAELIDDSSARVRFLDLADLIWRHIERRRIEAPSARGLWDEPTQVFAGTPFAPYGPSWYHTERVIEALVAAANVTESPPAATAELMESARQLLAEAEHLFDQGTAARHERHRRADAGDLPGSGSEAAASP